MNDDWLADLDGPLALFIACAFSGLGIPMPEDVPVVYAGVRIADGARTWSGTLPILFAGILTRDVLAWTIGRLFGARVLGSAWFQGRAISNKVDRARAMLATRGPMAVAVGRFMVGFRVPMFLAAGASGVRLSVFLLWDALAMLVSVPAVALLGYLLGPPVLEFAQRCLQGSGVFWAVVVAGAGFVAWRRLRAGQRAPVT